MQATGSNPNHNEVVPEGTRVRRGAGLPQRGSQHTILLIIEIRERGSCERYGCRGLETRRVWGSWGDERGPIEYPRVLTIPS
jgi:hypothetical protein